MSAECGSSVDEALKDIIFPLIVQQFYLALRNIFT
jgi:hypothetical protein